MGQGEDELVTPPASSPLWIMDGGDGKGVGGQQQQQQQQQRGRSIHRLAWQPQVHDMGGGISSRSSSQPVSSMSNSSANSTAGEQLAEDNRTFLDTETLCSLSSSLHPSNLSQRTFGRPAPVLPRHLDSLHLASATDDRLLTSLASPPARESFISFSTSSGFDSTAAGHTPNREVGEDSFLLSRQTSAATMALTMAGSAVDSASSEALPPSRFGHYHHDYRMHQEPEVELRLPHQLEKTEPEWQAQPPRPLHDVSLVNDLDYDHLFAENFPIQPLFLDRRPSSSRSHLRYWHRSKSPVPDTSRYLRVSSDGPSPAIASLKPLSMTMTREEFEALPPTIQRKYFSTLERLRFVSPDSVEDLPPRSACNDQSTPEGKPAKRRRHHKNRVASDSSGASSQPRPRVTSTDQRFLASLPDKIKRRHLTEEEQLYAQFRYQTPTPDTGDENLLKLGKRPSDHIYIDSPLASPGLSEGQTEASSMHSRQGNKTSHGAESKRTDSFYDSFRWLEEDDDLDLRLFLDDYHINLREEIPIPSKSRRPSFRRHLSINKLPFGRPSLSYSRPGTKDAATPPMASPSQSPVMGAPEQGHVRRKSRALSLISPNRQPMPHPITTFDPAAAHYQDPEARMKLRVFLASPQKFDEAIEFGFPSMEGIHAQEQSTVVKSSETQDPKAEDSDKLRTFLADDRSSTCSDEASMVDPESPKTPELFDKPTPVKPVRLSTERSSSRGEHGQTPGSREMTLRMTLTRPDLRAHEEQIYGWKQAASGRKSHSREDSQTGPVIYARDGNSKDSIERQLAALDHWNENTTENGVVKRIWNRVRRS